MSNKNRPENGTITKLPSPIPGTPSAAALLKDLTEGKEPPPPAPEPTDGKPKRREMTTEQVLAVRLHKTYEVIAGLQCKIRDVEACNAELQRQVAELQGQVTNAEVREAIREREVLEKQFGFDDKWDMKQDPETKKFYLEEKAPTPTR